MPKAPLHAYNSGQKIFNRKQPPANNKPKKESDRSEVEATDILSKTERAKDLPPNNLAKALWLTRTPRYSWSMPGPSESMGNSGRWRINQKVKRWDVQTWSKDQ